MLIHGSPSQRLREMAIELGYEGGKTVFDDYVREVRPRFVGVSGQFGGESGGRVARRRDCLVGPCPTFIA